MENQFNWKTKDGLNIYAVDWPIKDAKAVILLIHGLGEHVHRYEHLVEFMHSHLIAVIGYDRRGHGKSEGKKGHTVSYDAFLDEIDHLLSETKVKYPDLPVYLYGHSMGGNLLLNFIIERYPAVAGAIATAAHISLSFTPNAVTLTLGKLMKSIYPGFSQNNGLDVNMLSRDQKVVQTYLDDPYVHDQLTAITGMNMLEKADFLNDFSGDFPVPLLIMHGSKDGITSPEGSKDFANRVGGDVTLKIWEGLYHEIQNEPEQKEVFETVLNWINAKE